MSVHELQHDDPLLSHKRPYSIDLTLELEHQLENESLPPTPAHRRQQSLDPNVLASIVMQLRHSLAEVSDERDKLLHQLSEAQSQESYLKDTVQNISEKCTRLQDELEAAKEKIKDDEDAIAMLRTKVEESRRGVMRLQSESRRLSQGPMTLDISRASISLPGPASSKRASFTPLTGSGAPRPGNHRRISSVSDSALFNPDSLEETGSQVVLGPDSKYLASSSRRISGILRSPSQPEPSQDPITSEITTLRHELKSIKDELEATKHALSESNEAREASETCVKALRDFIGENNIGGPPTTGGARSIKLPLPPTMTTGEEMDSRKSSGWRFKLWTVDTTVKPASNSSRSASPAPASSPSPGAMTPLSKKLGEFFGSRASMSSTSSQPLRSASEKMYHGSDSSSIRESLTEPISPHAAEVMGAAAVIARDGVSSSELGESLDQMKDGIVNAS